jgi:hypothetical protein
MQTFSINSAALLLERDRRTLTKALLAIKPDEKERGQARWKMSTIVAALAALERPAAGSANTGSNPLEYAAFDRAYDEMKALPTLAKRRAAAVKLVPMIENMMTAVRAHGLANGEDPFVTGLRSDRIYQLTLIGFKMPCEWTHEQAWQHLCIDVDAA